MLPAFLHGRLAACELALDLELARDRERDREFFPEIPWRDVGIRLDLLKNGGNSMLMMKADAISLLKEDHKKVRELLKQLDETTSRGTKKRKTLVSQIAGEIKVHTTIEEEIFYPAYKAAAEKKDELDLYFEAKEEHHVVDMVLPELQASDPASDEFGAKATVLRELIEHHAKEEEREMFPKAKKLLDKEELVTLGIRMEARKKELKKAKKGGK